MLRLMILSSFFSPFRSTVMYKPEKKFHSSDVTTMHDTLSIQNSKHNKIKGNNIRSNRTFKNIKCPAKSSKKQPST